MGETKIRNLIVYLLYGVAFFEPLHPLLGDVFIIAALIVVVVGHINYKHLLQFNFKWQYAFFIFMGWSLLSTINSPQPLYSQLSWLYNVFLYGTVYILMTSFMCDRKTQQNLIKVVVASAIVVCIIGIFQYIHIPVEHVNKWVDMAQFPGLKRRMFSTLFNPNLFGEYLLFILSLTGTGIILSVKSGNWRRTLYLLPVSLLFTVCLILTYSRGIWVSLALIVLYWGVVIDKRLLLSLLLVPIILFFYHGEVASRLWSLFDGNDTSTLLRLALWDSTTYMIIDHPILGIGWDSFKWVYPNYNYFIQEKSVMIFHAHNMFLNILAETGLPGAVAYFTAIYGQGIITWQHARKYYMNARVAHYAIGAMIVGVTVSGLFDHDLFSHQISTMFWLLMGWGLACIQDTDREIKNARLKEIQRNK